MKKVKRNFKNIINGKVPAISEEAIKKHLQKTQKISNTRSDDRPLFELLSEHRSEYEKIRINGESIDEIISKL